MLSIRLSIGSIHSTYLRTAYLIIRRRSLMVGRSYQLLGTRSGKVGSGLLYIRTYILPVGIGCITCTNVLGTLSEASVTPPDF